MTTCIRCAKSIEGFETVSVTGGGDFCYPCYNDDVARAGRIRFDNAQLEPVTLQDAAGEPHTFLIQSLLVPTGHLLKAVEIQDGEPRGHLFQVLGDFDGDAMALFAKLYRRMRDGLATRHVEEGSLGWQVTDGSRVVARIEYDPESDDRLPLLVIDGKELSWNEVGRMLMSFESFTIDMTIRDSIEVVGHPPLETDDAESGEAKG
jgi:hypothetical protein